MTNRQLMQAASEQPTRSMPLAFKQTAFAGTDSVISHPSLLQSIGLHLLPGALTTAVYALLAPIMMASGFPALFALLLAALLVLIPCEFGYLLYQAQKNNRSFSLQGVVLYRQRVPVWQYVVFPLGLLIWGAVISGVISPYENRIGPALFPWLPDWFFISGVSQFRAYSRSALLATFILGLVVNGLVGPIVEELYFRGYWLPRLSRLGRWAPLLHAVLFSLYHFWAPWQNLSRILLIVPWAYTVWWKRNIYLGILMHCAIDVIGWVLTFGLMLRATP